MEQQERQSLVVTAQGDVMKWKVFFILFIYLLDHLPLFLLDALHKNLHWMMFLQENECIKKCEVQSNFGMNLCVLQSLFSDGIHCLHSSNVQWGTNNGKLEIRDFPRRNMLLKHTVCEVRIIQIVVWCTYLYTLRKLAFIF